MNTVRLSLIIVVWLLALCACRQPTTTVVEHHYPNGKLQERYGVVKNTDQKEGLYEEWFDTGQKYREIQYRAGLKNGLYVEYSPFSNEKRLEAYYHNDQMDGRCIEWYRGDGGLKTIEKEYHQDKFYGVKATWYYDNGEKNIEIDYDPLVLREVKSVWNEQGELLKKTVIDRRGKKEYDYSVTSEQ
jgi:antitoxin component YwqK of YwqJK toxin-antitoxin module